MSFKASLVDIIWETETLLSRSQEPPSITAILLVIYCQHYYAFRYSTRWGQHQKETTKDCSSDALFLKINWSEIQIPPKLGALEDPMKANWGGLQSLCTAICRSYWTLNSRDTCLGNIVDHQFIRHYAVELLSPIDLVVVNQRSFPLADKHAVILDATSRSRFSRIHLHWRWNIRGPLMYHSIFKLGNQWLWKCIIIWAIVSIYALIQWASMLFESHCKEFYGLTPRMWPAPFFFLGVETGHENVTAIYFPQFLSIHRLASWFLRWKCMRFVLAI